MREFPAGLCASEPALSLADMESDGRETGIEIEESQTLADPTVFRLGYTWEKQQQKKK